MSEQHAARFLLAGARGALDAARWAVFVGFVGAAYCGWFAQQTAQRPGWLWLAVLLLAASLSGVGASLWYGTRIAIDRQLFATLSDILAQQNESDRDVLAALDDALVELRWIDTSKTNRSLNDRVRGTVTLTKRAGIVALLQWLFIGATTLVWVAWGP